MADDTDKILEKVEKLLRLAAVNPNEQEAAAATAKAQDLLAAYNLDMSAVEERADGGGKRLQEEFDGGYYDWQRELWDAVADLNFCHYINSQFFLPSPLGNVKQYRKTADGTWKYVSGFWRRRHRVIGRKVNVAATNAMATYLEGVCDRLTTARVRQAGERQRGRWANSFRKGITDRIIIKIYDRRSDLLSEEKRKEMEETKRRQEAEISSVSTSKALTLSSYSKSERDANIDFVYGEGTSAKWAEERARKAAAEREAEEEYTRWAAKNPEKARKLEAEREAKERRAEERESRAYFRGKDIGAYSEGYEAGDEVSLDLQTTGTKVAGYL